MPHLLTKANCSMEHFTKLGCFNYEWQSNTDIYMRNMTICIYIWNTCTYIVLCFTHTQRERERERELVSFQKDSRLNPSHLNTNIRHSNTRSTPLKLIYIISSIYKSKIKYFEYVLHASSSKKIDNINSELVSLTV